MDVLRAIVTLQGCIRPESKDRSDTRQIVFELIGKMGPALIYWYHFATSGIRTMKTQTLPKDSVAVNFLKLLKMTDQVSKLEEKALDVSLILYAEHDFNASAFASRITASTLSDIYRLPLFNFDKTHISNQIPFCIHWSIALNLVSYVSNLECFFHA